MAHEIHEHDGLVLNRESAWHGLGKILNEDMTPRQALKAAGLDWEIEMTALKNILPNGTEEEIEGYQAVTRMDTKEVFGVFSKYTPVQNSELFDLAYTLSDEVLVESAGSLFNGRKVFCCLRGDSFDVGGGDVVERYLVLSNSHDGTLSLSAIPSSIRVVCNNTLSLALKTGSKRGFNIKHTANAKTKITEMEKALKRFKETGTWFEEQVDYLAKKELNKKKLMAFFTDCYDKLVGAPETEREELAAEQAIEAWSTTLETERMMFNTSVTAWGATNAVTQWIQHRESARPQDGWQERRQYNNFFGTTADDSVLVANMALSI